MRKFTYLFTIIVLLISAQTSFCETSGLSLKDIKHTVAIELELLNRNTETVQLDSLQNYIEFALSHNKQLRSLYFKWASSVEILQ